jgi:hypothetical protein
MISAMLPIFMLLLATVELSGQLALPANPLSIESVAASPIRASATRLSRFNGLRHYWLSAAWLPASTVPAARISANPALPQVYQYDELSFFCKWEVQLEQSARMPVKFRLGSVDYVDWLEGKRRSY